MNGVMAKAQKRNIRRAVGEEALSVLEHQRAQVQWALDALATEVIDRKNGDDLEISARLELAKTQRTYVDSEISAVLKDYLAFKRQGFWSRLKWMLVGCR